MARPQRSLAKTRPDGEWLFYGLLLLLAVEYLGLSKDVPILKTVRFSTLLAYGLLILTLARSADVGALWKTRQMRIFASFLVFTVLSLIWAVVQTYAFNTIRDFVDGTVLFVLVALLVTSRRRIDKLSWACLLMVVVLVARNADSLSDASRTIHFHAAGGFLGDGNDFAWGLVTFLPLIVNLVMNKDRAISRIAGVLGIVVCIAGIVGSGSRGATLGLMAACLYYWVIESRRKSLTAAVLIVGLIGVLMLAPQGYLSRMQTVGEYKEDSSAQARLQTWGAAMKMAVHYPLGVGAGNFAAAYGRYYIPDAEDNRIAWAGGRWLSAHSIYFRVLGEYGVLGLALLLWLILGSIVDNFRLRAVLVSQGADARLSSTWPSLLNMSTIGFAVCGIFLGGLTYPHLFILAGLAAASKRIAGVQVGVPKQVGLGRRSATSRSSALQRR